MELNESYIPLFTGLLFLVAFLYSSVGHGGASGYLALMVFFGFSAAVMKPTALILNLCVSLTAFIQYYRAGYFRWNLFFPFIILSFPASYIGGMITVDETLYKRILGFMLLFPVLRLFGFFGKDPEYIRKAGFAVSLLIGLIIGFFSGLIGIGGGIILSPVILLLHWADMRQTAAVSALFIFVNSFAGLSGQLVTGVSISEHTGLMLITALLGGLAGSYYGVHKFNTLWMRRFLALVLLIASVKLIAV